MVIVVLAAYDPETNSMWLTKASGTPADMLEICEIWRQCGWKPVVDEIIEY